MSERDNFIVYDKLKAYMDELWKRKYETRMELVKKLRAARELGDLSDNPTYDAVREEMTENEDRIEELERIVKRFIKR